MSTFSELRKCPVNVGPMKVDLQHGTLHGPLALCFLSLLTAPGQLVLFGLAAASSRLGLTMVRDALFGALLIGAAMVSGTIHRRNRSSPTSARHQGASA